MVKIVLSKVAKNDLRDIVNYIKRNSEKYAVVERKKIKNAIDKLQHQPMLGKALSELNIDPLRELIFQNYRIIYEVIDNDSINILTIHHHARSLTNNAAFTDED